MDRNLYGTLSTQLRAKTIEPILFSDRNEKASHKVLSLTIDEYQHLWIATENEPVKIYNIAQKSFVHYFTSEYDHLKTTTRIYCIYKSNSGTIWLSDATGKGIIYVNPEASINQKFINNFTLPFNSETTCHIWAMDTDNDGNLWTATSGTGIIGFPQNGSKVAQYTVESGHIPTNLCYEVMFDHNDICWVGTTEGVFRFVREGMTLRPADDKLGYHVKHLENNNIWTIYENAKGNVYIGTHHNGFYIWNPTLENWKHYQHDVNNPNSPGSNFPLYFYENKDGTLWISFLGFGFSHFDPNTEIFTHYPAKTSSTPEISNGLNDTVVTSFHDSGDGKLWIGTNTGGLNRLDLNTGQFEVFGENNGLPTNTIISIIPTRNDKMLLVSNRIIYEYSPESGVTQRFRTGGYAGHVANYKRLDDDTVIFGGIGGCLLLQTPKTSSNKRPESKVIISSLSLLGKTIEPDETRNDKVLLPKQIHLLDHIEIPYHEKQIRFSISLLDSPEFGIPQFQTKLEPVNDNWVDLGHNEKSITFQQLKPGKYTFRVRGKISNREWMPSEAVLEIVVSAPFWLKLKYQILIGLLTLLLLLYLNWLIINSIRKRNRKLQQINDQLNSEIKQRRDAELVSIKARDEALTANSTKDDFLRMVSHELRTPLNPIINFADLTLSDERLAPELLENLQFIRNSSDELLDLIDKILDYSHLQSYLEAQQHTSFTLESLVHDIEKRFIPIFNERTDISFHIDLSNISDSGCLKTELNGDHSKTIKILKHLLSNAEKFTPKGKVCLNLKRLKEDADSLLVRFAISDTGVGIDEQQQENIFNEFTQADTSITRSHGGLGLGLKLSKEFAKLLNGSIHFESELGSGSTFYLDLPLTKKSSPKSK